MYEDLIKFLNNEECFIEAEGKLSAITTFITSYNKKFGTTLSSKDDGINGG